MLFRSHRIKARIKKPLKNKQAAIWVVIEKPRMRKSEKEGCWHPADGRSTREPSASRASGKSKNRLIKKQTRGRTAIPKARSVQEAGEVPCAAEAAIWGDRFVLTFSPPPLPLWLRQGACGKKQDGRPIRQAMPQFEYIHTILQNLHFFKYF